MKPRIGKQVHYRTHGGDDGLPPECHAAMITAVQLPGLNGEYDVSLAVLAPSGLSFPELIPYDEDMVPGTWHYPDHDDDLPEEPPDPEHVMAKP